MAQPFQISLNNFRAFDSTGDVSIAPLTLLVGENSTGKSSFLSALRFAFNLNSASEEAYFNSYPFDLGGYEDIVHDAGSRTSKDEFSVCVEKNIDLSKGSFFGSRPGQESELVIARMTFFFRSSYGDVIISRIRLDIDEGHLSIKFSDDPEISIRTETKTILISDGQSNLFNARKTAKGITNIRSALFALMDHRFRPQETGRSAEDIAIIDRFSVAYDAFLNTNYSIVCSPPVRSVPRRVYTASDDTGNRELSHAPHELNRLKRANQRQWTRLHSGLSRFGKLAGLFTRFDIKKLTNQDSGPFQVKVTVRGRSSTIADVGYGVSQALPIMTDLLEAGSKPSVFLLQQPEVHLHPRAQASLGTMFSEFISSSSNSYVVAETHSDYLLDRIRIEIREGKLSHQNVNIIYFQPNDNGVKLFEISIDKQGNLINCPDDYRQFFIREQERVLGF